MHGILLIDKPGKVNSHTVVNRLRLTSGITQIGHGGTLDPLATGVLVVLFGRAVKLSEYIIGHDKEYEVTGRFGEMRDTMDALGKLTETSDRIVERPELERAVAEFPREYPQVPPAFSAKKIRGVPAYRLARGGRKVKLEAKTVRIERLELVSFDFPHFTLRTRVSSGTYIRCLVVDLARRIDTIACVEVLRRTASGRFTVDGAFPFEQARAWSPETLAEHLRPMEDAVIEYPAVDLTATQAKRFTDGQWIPIKELPTQNPPLPENHRLRIRREGEFIALGFFDQGNLKVEKVLLR